MIPGGRWITIRFWAFRWSVRWARSWASVFMPKAGPTRSRRGGFEADFAFVVVGVIVVDVGGGGGLGSRLV